MCSVSIYYYSTY
jgi:hypothetical protein